MATATPLTARRERAATALASLEMPAFRGVPGWEFTPIDKLDLDAYEPAPGGTGAELFSFDDAILPSEEEAVVEGPVVMPLALAAERHPDLVETHLGSVMTKQTPFTARNDALWTDGAFVYVPRNMAVEAPIVLSTVLEQAGSALHWRALVAHARGPSVVPAAAGGELRPRGRPAGGGPARRPRAPGPGPPRSARRAPAGSPR